MSYYAVYEGVGGPCSNYEGIRTRSSYRSEDDFRLAHQNGQAIGNQDLLIYHGTDEEEAKRQCYSSATARADVVALQVRENPNLAQTYIGNQAAMLKTADEKLEFATRLAEMNIDVWLGS